MSKKPIKIKVSLIAESDKKGVFNVQGDDNKDYAIWFGTDRIKKPLPEIGQVIVCFENEKNPNQLNYWKVDTPPEGGSSSAKNSSGSKSKGGSDFQQRDSYWKDKYDYEVNFRDVEIRFQTILAEMLKLTHKSLGSEDTPNAIPLEKDAKGNPVFAGSVLEAIQWAGTKAQAFLEARDEFLKSESQDTED